MLPTLSKQLSVILEAFSVSVLWEPQIKLSLICSK